MINRHNHEYSGGFPLSVGDRLYAQDLARDTHYLLENLGLVLGDLARDPASPGVLVSGGYVTQGAGDTLTIAPAVGYCAWDVTVIDPAAAWTDPPSTATRTIGWRRAASTQQTNMAIPSATLDGATVNYVKLRYAETNIGQVRQRRKKAGTYAWERVPSFTLVVSAAAPGAYDAVLASFVGSPGGTFAITQREPFSLAVLAPDLLAQDDSRRTDQDATLVSATAEVVPADGVDLVSSLGLAPAEAPYPRVVTWEPPKLGTLDQSGYQSPWGSALPRTRWAGRGCVGLFPATTNLLSTPDDLSGWTDVQTTHFATFDTTLLIPMAKVAKTVAATADYVYLQLAANSFSIATPCVEMILKKGTAGIRSDLMLYDTSASATRLQVQVTWGTHTVSFATGSGGYSWLDTNTIHIWGIATGVVAANVHQVRVYPGADANGSIGDYCWAAQGQAENNALPTPYTPAGRSAGVLKYHMPIPAAGTLAFWFRPTGYGGSNHPADAEIACFIEYAKSGANWYTNNLFDLKWDSTTANQVRLRINDSGGVARANATDSTWTFVEGVWHHVAITWSGMGTAAGAVTVYVDGVAKAALTLSGLALGSFGAGAAAKLFLGGDGQENTPATPGAQANALFTDMLFDSVVWTAGQLLAHVTAAKPWPVSGRAVGPNLRWKLDRHGNLLARRLFDEAGRAATVVESGSNANGWYLKFSDGTLICWGSVVGTTSSVSNNNIGTYGWSYNYASPTWTFPHVFISIPSISAVSNGASAVWTSLTVISVLILPINTSSVATTASVIAIGRWKP